MHKKLYYITCFFIFNSAFCPSPKDKKEIEALAKDYACDLKKIVTSEIFGLYAFAFDNNQDFFTDDPCNIFCKRKEPSHGCCMKLFNCRYYDLKCEIEQLTQKEWAEIKPLFPKTKKSFEFIRSIEEKDESIWIQYCIENNLHGCKDKLEQSLSKLKLKEIDQKLVQANKCLFLNKLNQFKELKDSPGLNKTKCCQWIVDKLLIDSLDRNGICLRSSMPPPKSEIKPSFEVFDEQNFRFDKKLFYILSIGSICIFASYFIVKILKRLKIKRKKNSKHGKTINSEAPRNIQ